ncbi:MarR family winged helix-turn-helix transcriptional regulator [Solicola gregarius]|uniref:MarR family winged helix-turn-helix transcriptional regulator n=1 Tax=Solicola gregarius TaxID=2908642 RepID=A0AA46YL18_9ACTN|nr:MarR family winged helix-turn-helix transcriptional regulator [Solicola gregarius]UYM06420.1 MarR family winged helix-turn-helix transcriptional regulator [Solicola gregarius]
MASQSDDRDRLRQSGVAYLMSVVGIQSSKRWQARLEPLGIDPREMVVLRMVAAEPGRTQRSLGPALDVPPSRIVAVIDALEARGLVERRARPDDRRANALHLTRRGKSTLSKLMNVSREHEQAMTEGLSRAESATLGRLLSKVARHEGLSHGGHPGFVDEDHA